ncbi:bifunctional chorismate-binding protein/class IV aminotransferase [Helicobacter jaachi]|uniref:bifunctional chorismate-binding protein/class IV aminotransferase n=1 Tax=Helicobacter jaachi TaxID=1677920 RepID=UPI000513CDD8|nr:bifunctional anthranilate synthase component I family protein/class IV aminotransferase [Helicobacter jaachi]
MIYGSFSYKKPLRRLVAFDLEGVLSALDSIERVLDSQKKQHLKKHHKELYFVGYITYEAGVLLQTYQAKSYQTLFQRTQALITRKREPLLYFVLFSQRVKITFKNKYKNPSSLPLLSLLQGLDSKVYANGFNAIKAHIAKGDTYQVNYTNELLLHSMLKPKQLFKRLLCKQPTPYRAYMRNAFLQILCFSPELFFEIKHQKITIQPMKGTIRRADSINKSTQSDKQLKAFLRIDAKNRSENMMIVDLLRNDLSKIIAPHSLRIKELCAIHSYPSLHQMVSTLQGRLEKHTTIKALLQALFPCGSITGAPKLKTMQIISALESRTRSVYCGALGVISAHHTCLCVPIRTLFKHHSESFYRYGVGSGVVWDSVCEDEFAELLLKAQFLGASLESYGLFETMLYEHGHIFLLHAHIARMLKSAQDLGFNCAYLSALHERIAPVGEQILSFNDFLARYTTLAYRADSALWQDASAFFAYLNTQMPTNRAIIRLMLSFDGKLAVAILPIQEVQSRKIVLSPAQEAKNMLVYHKTTSRAHFAKASELIKEARIFDMIFYNHKGFITEGSRSNVVCEINHRFYTPALKCGLLGGTLRALMLDNHLAREASLTLTDLQNAQRIWCINSVRGVIEVSLADSV